MSVPCIDDSRESYIERQKAAKLWIAERHCELGNDFSMWQMLLTWVQCEEIYGEHFDKLKEKT
jgi:hypothetical protein